MAAVSNVLPRIFSWAFLIFAAAFALATLFIGIVILIDPTLPPSLHFGPYAFEAMGQPATVAFRGAGGDFEFAGSLLRGNLTIALSHAAGLIEVLKHYGLPVLLLRTTFFAALFELLRRLFRNVERGESFSRDTITLVQAIGGLLIVFAFVFAFAESLFGHAVAGYLMQNAQIAIAGTPVRFPQAHPGFALHVDVSPFGSPLFFCGLLVLALSEVFRQGLALRKENELTI